MKSFLIILACTLTILATVTIIAHTGSPKGKYQLDINSPENVAQYSEILSFDFLDDNKVRVVMRDNSAVVLPYFCDGKEIYIAGGSCVLVSRGNGQLNWRGTLAMFRK